MLQVGKWDLGHYSWAHVPTRRGFESFVGYYGPEEDYFTHRLTPVQLRLDVWHIANRSSGGDLDRCAGASFTDLRDGEARVSQADTDTNTGATPDARAEAYSTRLFGDAAEQVIATHAGHAAAAANIAADASATPDIAAVAAQDADQRLFLYVAHQAAHYPIEAPNETIALYRDEIFPPSASRARSRFAAAVHELDESLARLVTSLRQHELYDDTVLFFLSDNGAVPGSEGGGANWPLRGGKFTAYEGGVRVPAFVHAPRYLRPRWAATRYPALFHVTDVMPTLLELAGVTSDGDDDDDDASGAVASRLDGVSHATALFGADSGTGVAGRSVSDDARRRASETADGSVSSSSSTSEAFDLSEWPRQDALLHADRLGYKDEDMGFWSGAFVALERLDDSSPRKLYKLHFNSTVVGTSPCSPDSDEYAAATVCGYTYPSEFAAAAHRVGTAAAASQAGRSDDDAAALTAATHEAYAAAFNLTELYDLDGDPYEGRNLVGSAHLRSAEGAATAAATAALAARLAAKAASTLARTATPSRYRDPDTGFVVAQYIWFARHGCAVTPWGSGATPWGAMDDGDDVANQTFAHDAKYEERSLGLL